MSQRIIGRMTCSFAVFALFVLISSQAHAIPAFSRAHKVECTTCHTMYPELNEYGEAFLKNSYVYVGKGSKAAKKPIATPAATPAAAKDATGDGAPVVKGDGDAGKLSKLKAGAMGASAAPQTAAAPAESTEAETADTQSEGMKLAGIPEQLPISFTGSINYSAGDRNNSSPGDNNVDFSARSFKLQAGGNFRDKVGFFVTYLAYSEQNTGTPGVTNTSTLPSNNKTDINEFFLQWRNALGTPVNVKIGRFQPKLGLWKSNNKLSMTYNYIPYSYTVGTLTSGSVFRVDQTQDAIELNSTLGKRFFTAAGIVNHKGQNQKDGYGHFSYKFGGADYLGNEPNVDLDKEENVLDFLTVSTGAYGYYGQNGIYDNNAIPRNTFYRAGLDAEVLYKIFRMRMLAGFGHDDNVLLNTKPTPWTNVISKAATVEGEVTLLVNLIAAGRFEYLQEESGNTPVNPTLNNNKNIYIRRYVGTIGYAPLENLKLALEYKYEIGPIFVNTVYTPNSINRIGTASATFSF
jgi:hypothetical protein